MRNVRNKCYAYEYGNIQERVASRNTGLPIKAPDKSLIILNNYTK